MRDAYSSRLNDLLVEIFDSVLEVEEMMLKNMTIDVSITELHTLEAVGKYKEQGCTISALAQDLEVTLPTVTVCIKRLEKKTYVEKIRSEVDGRMVRIVLTRKGQKLDTAHKYFHEQMVRSLIKEVGTEERPVLLKSLENLEAFLLRQVERAKTNI